LIGVSIANIFGDTLKVYYTQTHSQSRCGGNKDGCVRGDDTSPYRFIMHKL